MLRAASWTYKSSLFFDSLIKFIDYLHVIIKLGLGDKSYARILPHGVVYEIQGLCIKLSLAYRYLDTFYELGHFAQFNFAGSFQTFNVHHKITWILT